MDRVILHSDINACYASIERLYDDTLKNTPYAVCGSQAERHGIVLAKDERAKRMGVKTGMAVWQARQCCPELRIVEPHFDRYIKHTNIIREIYAEYTDLCEAFGLDESWLDITNCIACPDGEHTAQELRKRIKRETGLTVSIGVSWNKVFAKLGSDYRKPDAVTVIKKSEFKNMVWPLPATDMLFVGRSTGKTLKRLGINTIGDVAAAPPELLKACLGKNGIMLHAYANGMDVSRVSRPDEMPPPKSIGNSVTPYRDIMNMSDARTVLLNLAESVGERMRKDGLRCRTVEVAIRSTDLTWSSHRMQIRYATDISRELFEYGTELLCQCHDFSSPLRGMGLRALDLVRADAPEQIDILLDYVNINKQRSIDAAVDRLRDKYGRNIICRASLCKEKSPLNIAFSHFPESL